MTNQALVSLVVTDGIEVTDTLKQQILDQFAVIGSRKIVSISIIYTSEVSGGYRETDRIE